MLKFTIVNPEMRIINREAVAKKKEMEDLGFKSGKSYRRYCKKMRTAGRKLAAMAEEQKYHGE